MMTEDEANYQIFDSYQRKASKLKGYDQHTRDLTGMRELFDRLNIDTAQFPAITVTGSKGKGSTSIAAASILRGFGLRVGLLTSPHYLSLRERIRVNGQMINEYDYRHIITEIAPEIRRVDSALPEDKYLSPTGLFLAVAMKQFAESWINVDAIVLEVGRGGRYDDVSLIENQVACFTPITGEHLDKLGPTVTDVAWHKAGIIKPESVIVSAPQPPDVEAIIRAEADKHSNPIHIVDSLPQKPYDFTNPGAFLQANTQLAFKAAWELTRHNKGLPLRRWQMREVLKRTQFPGRTDLIHTGPDIWVDGAINRASAAQFFRSVEKRSAAPRVLITALPHDKDYTGLLDTLAPHVETVIVTHVSAGHLMFNDAVFNYAQQVAREAMYRPDVHAAFDRGLDLVGQTGTLWIVGTQSLVRDALAYWGRDLENLILPRN